MMLVWVVNICQGYRAINLPRSIDKAETPSIRTISGPAWPRVAPEVGFALEAAVALEANDTPGADVAVLTALVVGVSAIVAVVEVEAGVDGANVLVPWPTSAGMPFADLSISWILLEVESKEV